LELFETEKITNLCGDRLMADDAANHLPAPHDVIKAHMQSRDVVNYTRISLIATEVLMLSLTDACATWCSLSDIMQIRHRNFCRRRRAITGDDYTDVVSRDTIDVV